MSCPAQPIFGGAFPFRDMTPHIRRLFDAYGPLRCYWDLT